MLGEEQEPRWNKPYQTEEVHCSDRYSRELDNGVKAYVALWFIDEGDYYLEVIFRAPKGMPHAEVQGTVGPITDDIVEALGGSWWQWGEYVPLGQVEETAR
jgi:hypothetical protein